MAGPTAPGPPGASAPRPAAAPGGPPGPVPAGRGSGAAPEPAGAAGPGGPPLLITCALGIERHALRSAAAADPAAVTVLRTGMGPRAARQAVTRALRAESAPGGTAVLAAGFCAGLVPGMHPGDLVVAEATHDLGPGAATAARPPGGHGPDRTACEGAGLLAAALAPFGTVHTGVLAGTGHIVRGTGRAALRAASGAVAVDMESAAVLRAAASAPAAPTAPDAPGAAEPVRRRPVAAVRVVVDAPGHELIRFGTLRGGVSAFRVLRGVLPAFLEWHRSLLLPGR